MELIKFKPVSIKNHPELNEKWVQDQIANDPKILGLGDVILKDRERTQPRAGRLDLLFQDAEYTHRYEVELQLGSTDESHIIRTIEYWDIERKRYPQYEHTAVIVAEDITSRFLNVINLFNGMIPLIAIQMKALQYENKIGLMFTTVVDILQLGTEEEEEEEPADRAYWENRSSEKILSMADQLLQMAKDHDPRLHLNYTKLYIGLARDGMANNFLLFRPKKGFLRLDVRLKEDEETRDKLESAGLDVMEYDYRARCYRIRLRPEDLESYKDLLKDVVAEAYKASAQE